MLSAARVTGLCRRRLLAVGGGGGRSRGWGGLVGGARGREGLLLDQGRVYPGELVLETVQLRGGRGGGRKQPRHMGGWMNGW
jgi:hypothetical protein